MNQTDPPPFFGSLPPFGSTRTRVTDSYALLAPEGHVAAPLAHWLDGSGKNAPGVILISPAMGAQFVQYLIHAEKGTRSEQAPLGVQRFVFVEAGALSFRAQGHEVELEQGHFAFVPADVAHVLEAKTESRLWVFEKPFEPRDEVELPTVVFGSSAVVESVPFMGDEDAMLQSLLPDTPAYDMAVNLFTYQSGATLPFVETHIMEHGLVMVDGMGIYRLGDDWHPVQKGDVIWMAPYCPQWFVAVGKQPAAYLYYKDVNRDPLA